MIVDLIKSFVSRALPVAGERATPTTRRLRDLRSTLRFIRPSTKKAMKEALASCRTTEDVYSFTHRWMHGGAMQKLAEIEAVIDYLKPFQPKNLCEIGTADGGTNLMLSHLIGSIELIIGVDLYIMNSSYLRLLRKPSHRLHLINGSSYQNRTLERVRHLLAGQKLDILLIDGDHRYEGCRKDFMLYRELVRDGGFILFHDIVPDHGQRLGRPTAAWSGGVPQLWQELKMQYPHKEFVESLGQDGYGIGILHYSHRSAEA